MNIYEISDLGEKLQNNTYPGRGIVVGLTEDGKKAFFAYFIMGRSENSRNRIFIEENEDIKILPFDESKVQDPSLIIYYPVRKIGNDLIVTNGDQTDTIFNFVKEGKTFEQALDTRQFEPDRPNYTPRLSAMLYIGKEYQYKMSILKSADSEGTACNRYTYTYSALKGLGHFIHTYECDGNPIPTFQGEPERVKIPNSFAKFSAYIWESLNKDNKVSLVCEQVDLETGKVEKVIKNKHIN